jgi:hypothetical protein
MKPQRANWVKSAAIAAAAVGALVSAPASHADSVARDWNETLLASIRKDTPRPPVQARNLFHASAAMYDAWAAFEPGAKPFLFNEKIAAKDVDAAQREAISYAVYRLLSHRFAGSPQSALINSFLNARMAELGYPTGFTSTTGSSPAAVGNRIAAQLIAWSLADGSREQFNHAAAAGTYPVANPGLVFSLPFAPNLASPNRWQPLAFGYTTGTSGEIIPTSVQPRLTPFWGAVRPFALLESDKDPTRPGVYFDPEDVPLLNGAGNAAFRAGHEQVLHRSSWLTPDDGVMIDISPAAMGNNPLGTDDGVGRPLNPVTGLPYEPNVVKRGDWARSLAEFWADGPTSSTPPGNWNEIANAVVDHPAFSRRIGGKGPELEPLEWDVKMYLTLNGALHDTAVAVWGIKSHYDAVRPISAIRHLAQNGQCTDPTLPSFSVDGLTLAPGVVELITHATTAPGQRHQALAGFEGEVASLSWPGVPADVANQHSGVRWIRAGTWLPYQRPTFMTPPFGGYISGHSTFSRSAATVLTALTGSEYFPGGIGTYTCEAGNFLVFEDGPSQTLEFQWATYYDASDSAGQSRIYGGIHPTFDDYPGREIAGQIAGRALEKALDLFEPLQPCPADLDGNRSVDSADLGQLLASWGTAGSAADLNGDGLVDDADLGVLLAQWGSCP